MMDHRKTRSGAGSRAKRLLSEGGALRSCVRLACTLAVMGGLMTGRSEAGWLEIQECRLPAQQEPSSSNSFDRTPGVPPETVSRGCLQAVIDPTLANAYTHLASEDSSCSKNRPHALRPLDSWASGVAKAAGSRTVLIVNANFFFVDLKHFNPYATACTRIRGLICHQGIGVNERVEPGHKEWLKSTAFNDTHSLVISTSDGGSILGPDQLAGRTCADFRAVVSGYRFIAAGAMVPMDQPPPEREGLEPQDERLLWYHLLHKDEGLPRTAAGVKDGKIFLLTANNGTREGNMTLPGMADYLLRHGVSDAILLDGGGSSQLLYVENGQTRQSTLGSDRARWREPEAPPNPDQIRACEERLRCDLDQVPCTVAIGCHRPVPAFLAFTPR